MKGMCVCRKYLYIRLFQTVSHYIMCLHRLMNSVYLWLNSWPAYCEDWVFSLTMLITNNFLSCSVCILCKFIMAKLLKYHLVKVVTFRIGLSVAASFHQARSRDRKAEVLCHPAPHWNAPVTVVRICTYRFTIMISFNQENVCKAFLLVQVFGRCDCEGIVSTSLVNCNNEKNY